MNSDMPAEGLGVESVSGTIFMNRISKQKCSHAPNAPADLGLGQYILEFAVPPSTSSGGVAFKAESKFIDQWLAT